MVYSQDKSELLPFVDKLHAFDLPGRDLPVHVNDMTMLLVINLMAL